MILMIRSIDHDDDVDWGCIIKPYLYGEPMTPGLSDEQSKLAQPRSLAVADSLAPRSVLLKQLGHIRTPEEHKAQPRSQLPPFHCKPNAAQTELQIGPARPLSGQTFRYPKVKHEATCIRREGIPYWYWKTGSYTNTNTKHSTIPTPLRRST